ncbi:hypothetical protein ACFRAU_07315 [Arthrobacter sp. NPDC056691]|uniref:hypothetical protein n=1 Tax=Arthrobacter sp. NPDC056691 TaxID=3345913 RepID=UPI00366FECD9
MSTDIPTVTVDLTIQNIYPGEVIQTLVRNGQVPAPASLDADELDEWATEFLFPFTGTGREDGDSGYTISITGSPDQRLVCQVFEMG